MERKKHIDLQKSIKISVAIVLYKEDDLTLQKTIKCVLESKNISKLYLLDNSPKSSEEIYKNDDRVEYRFIGKNIGFGKAHNLVLEEIKTKSTHHLILNPDVIFDSKVLQNLVIELDKGNNISMIAPKVIYPNGEVQFTTRKQPRFSELIYRRLNINKKFIQSQEYRDQLSKSFYPDFIHGCFMLFKTEDFIEVNGFDERYFLYMEDADICREIKKQSKEILYFPKEQITHIHRKGSSKSIKLLSYHLISAIKYFNKWR